MKVVMDIEGPNPSQEEQQLMGQEVHGHIHQRPAIW